MNTPQTIKLIKALLQGPMSRIDMANKVGITAKSAGRLISSMKKEKLVYVIGYSNALDGRNRVKLYSLGEGEDVKPLRQAPQHLRSKKSYIKKVSSAKLEEPRTTFVNGKSPWGMMQ